MTVATIPTVWSCKQPTQSTVFTLNSIKINPANSSVAAGDSIQFTALGIDQNGHEVPINPIWSVSGGGAISDSGLFIAGKSDGTFLVTARQNEVTGNASVFVRWNSPYVAGFRASRILSSYPNYTFPTPDYWIRVGDSMAQKFSNASPAAVWIVSLYQGNGVTQADFPSSGRNLNYVEFSDSDYSELYLTRFDQVGLKVWLQVEPGAASVDTLIDLVLSRYGTHPCVAGFGVDVEWYNPDAHQWGQKVTDTEAQRWEQRVESYSPGYTLFLKHFATSWLPATYRGKIMFVDDSQQFTSLDQMVDEYKSWGRAFYPNEVSFQFGYPADKSWWGKYSDPAGTIGSALLSSIPNAHGVFWVDFTVSQVFPWNVSQKFQQASIKRKSNESRS